MTMMGSHSSLPSGSRSLLECPETPWRLSQQVYGKLQPQSGVTYKVAQLKPSDTEWNFVLAIFNHQKPANLAIKEIRVIHKARLQETFQSYIDTIEGESHKFPPTWKQEDGSVSQRQLVHDRWELLKKEFSPFNIEWSAGKVDKYVNTAVLPVWHGTNEINARSICETGLTHFGKHFYWDQSSAGSSTDHGYFGSGVYVTTSARYAADIYSDGTLLMCWASMRSPFPVISDIDGSSPLNRPPDVSKLEAKELYKKYNAHFIPVRSVSPDDPQCAVYYPCGPTESPSVDEIVLKNGIQTFPRFWIALQIDLPLSPSPPVFPPWQIPDPGLNLEAICENVSCVANAQFMFIKKSFGTFEMPKTWYSASCQECGTELSKMIRFFFYNCRYSYEGMFKNERRVEKIEEKNLITPLSREISLPDKEWVYLQIITEPI